ncbi:MAG TPA: amylo-alpha-1,6-glucosidase [Thermoanaerobaculia bacterium]|jgi:predicted glycogen debranching enzyme
MTTDVIQIGWRQGDSPESLLEREWLVTNGLGGYAAGTIGGTATRRFHGALIAALPAPLSRTMMLNHIEEWVTAGETTLHLASSDALEEFAVECGLPVWRYAAGGIRLEKRVVMPYLQNTTYLIYRLLEGPAGTTLHLRPALNFRAHEGLLSEEPSELWELTEHGRDLEISEGTSYPPLRLSPLGAKATFERAPRKLAHLIYRLEQDRGYDYEGPLWSPGAIRIDLADEAGLIVSVEPWEVIHTLSAREAFDAETSRRQRLLSLAGVEDNVAAQLVLAADQFLIRPTSRAADAARMSASGDEPRTVIAGYHWFTDWGRDTMISLEGLTLVTRRFREAGNILRTFASYIRDGLIPNMFPEGEHGGLYHTADATMWFFHAVHRYVRWTDDRDTLRVLLPKLVDIIEHHLRGTKFSIHVDPRDGLLHQGAEGYQLTWMDAKCDGWVVTPRRGKAVEINALFYNALRVLQKYLEEEGNHDLARTMAEHAARARESFNARFWFEDGQYLYDVLDPDDAALRPNQIFAVSLDYPVLDESRWRPVVDAVQRELWTPVGLRSLARQHPDYKPNYHGDLRTRDAAYHQGTVWGWLIGPFFDAWLRVHADRAGARELLAGFPAHLGEACIGTISEVFDAEVPFTARGCAAQAWSVAEVLRCLHALRQ